MPLTLPRRPMAGILAGATLLLGWPALAQPTIIHLPAGPLSGALEALSQQTGTSILFTAHDLAGHRVGRLDGTYAADGALQVLLSGQRLHVAHAPDGALVVQPAGAVAGTGRTDAATPAGAPEDVTVIGRAIRISPSSTPLDSTEPTSVIKKGFIANNIIPLASVDDIIKYQPSVWTQNPNGPGIGKAETMSLRGFQDGQYNITFDGIPFADASDLHHTTSSLFIAHFLDGVEVDRGPGTASTIGDATFGGTIGFTSEKPSTRYGVTAYGTYGSFDTRAGGIQLDTGVTGLGHAVLDMQHEETDGYLTNSAERRSNILFKDVAELDDRTTLTLMANYNEEWQDTTQGATLAEYARNGDDYGLCANRALQCYYGYNPSVYSYDFDYVGLHSRLASWLTVDNKLYTDGFEHASTESTDPSDDVASDNAVTFYTASGKKIATTSDIPGKFADAKFRAYGDTLSLTGHTAYGDIVSGVWADVQKDRRYSDSIDLSRGDIPVAGKNGSAFSYDIADTNTTLQPFLELDLHPLPGMTIKPGVKYSLFERDYDAAINKTTKTPLDATESFDSWQPSIAVNQVLATGWTAYAQVARGFLTPPQAVFQTQSVASLNPETTLNYQVGTVLRRRDWTISVDGYYIDFANYLAAAEIAVPGYGTESTYVNSNGAIYKGIEIEGQYALGHGFSLYGNYSVNDAHYKDSSVRVAETPNALAAFGLLYESRQGPYFSIIGKFVGNHWGLDSTTDTAGDTVFQNQYRIDSVVTADLAAGWRLRNVFGVARDLTPSIKISNLFDNRAVSDFAGNQSYASAGYPGGAPLYWRLAGRSIFFNLTATVP